MGRTVDTWSVTKRSAVPTERRRCASDTLGHVLKSGQRLTLTVADIRRFASKLRVEGGCKLWTGAILGRGYGSFYAAGTGNLRAHRAGFWIATGIFPGDRFVCHRCDRPLCCAIEHLFLGTHGENMADAARKGRMYSPHALLAQQVEMLASMVNAGIAVKAAAEHVGVSRTAAYAALRRRGGVR